MRYEFKCVNTKCKNYKKTEVISVPMSEISKTEVYCKECGERQERVFSSFSFKGFGEDAYKSNEA